MPISTTDQLKAAASKQALGKPTTGQAGAPFSKLSTKSSDRSSKSPTATSAKPAGRLAQGIVTPILNAALLDGSTRQHLLACERISETLDMPRTHMGELWRGLTKYSSQIIRNPRDRFDGHLPEFFILINRGETAQKWREMTGAELEEAGFAYGEHLEVLEMRDMELIGWVAEDNEEEMPVAIEATESV